MKLILLAAAVIATPVLAQTTMPMAPGQATTTPSTPMPDQTTPPAPTAGAGAMQQDQMPPATSQTTQSMPMSTSGDPVGGYAPSGPGYSGGMPGNGATVTFQAAPSPTEAFPPPAPMASYPMCKKGQFDHCMQGAGSTHSRDVRGRRSGGR